MLQEQTKNLSFKEIGNKLDVIIEKVQELHNKKTKEPKPIKQHV